MPGFPEPCALRACFHCKRVEWLLVWPLVQAGGGVMAAGPSSRPFDPETRTSRAFWRGNWEGIPRASLPAQAAAE